MQTPKPAFVFSLLLTAVGWITLMVSYWLPDPVGEALASTALSLLIPGAVGTCFVGVLYDEFQEWIDQRHKVAHKAAVLRCTDCGTKILNAGGTTIGDEIEGEVMLLPHLIEGEVRLLPHRDEKGNWIPPDVSPFDRKGR